MVAEIRDNRNGYVGGGDVITAIDEIWEDRDGEIGWKKGDGMGKYQ